MLRRALPTLAYVAILAVAVRVLRLEQRAAQIFGTARWLDGEASQRGDGAA